MKKINKIIILLLISIIVYIAFYTFPRNVHIQLSGIKYRLGHENRSYEEKIKLEIHGTLSKIPFLDDVFEGVIYINNDKIPLEIPNMKLHFDSRYRANLEYSAYNSLSNSMERYCYGEIYSNSKLNKIIICLMEPEIKLAPNKSWNSKNGLIISAPVTNRNEALCITKKLLNYKSQIQLE